MLIHNQSNNSLQQPKSVPGISLCNQFTPTKAKRRIPIYYPLNTSFLNTEKII